MGITIPSDVFELIAKSATHLVSFSIDRSESSYGGVRSIPIYCRKLLHLKIGVMSKSEVPFNSLFEGPSWNCHDLEEFTLEKVHWSSAELRYELVRDHTMETVWRVLASLRKLRVLALKGLDHKKYTYKKKGFRQLETLSFLERLHLSGLGSWEYTDVLWVVETFQWLETFAYAKNELSTPLWAWLRHNRPDLQLIAMD
ncbi:hypothetical protein BGZ46_003540 [Entomortierella lignicola]|nr:hypothetical protein BGZ46_003540 [Entomortierella lignicola]